MTDIKQTTYKAFRAIRDMDGVPIQTKHRMLWEMLFMNGSNPYFWRVVGITEKAFDRLVENNYRLPKGNRDNKINRSHIHKRMDTSKRMLEGELMDEDEWWEFYLDNDKCVLATASENMMKDEEVIKHHVPDGLFLAKGYTCEVGNREVEFLKVIEDSLKK